MVHVLNDLHVQNQTPDLNIRSNVWSNVRSGARNLLQVLFRRTIKFLHCIWFLSVQSDILVTYWTLWYNDRRGIWLSSKKERQTVSYRGTFLEKTNFVFWKVGTPTLKNLAKRVGVYTSCDTRKLIQIECV